MRVKVEDTIPRELVQSNIDNIKKGTCFVSKFHEGEVVLLALDSPRFFEHSRGLLKGYRVIQTIVVGAPKTSGSKPGDLYVYEVPVRTDPRDEDANHKFVKIVGEMDEITIKLGKLK